MAGTRNKAQRTWWDLLSDQRWSAGFVALLAFVLYANTIGNGFALDDGLVLRDNAYVLKGIRGIPDILTHDSFHGAIGNSVYLSGGRYRPLSLVMYAVEVAFFGPSPAVHHTVNVLLYALTALVILAFLRTHVFKERPLSALFCTVLFTVHPIHTEVVANIKGRDEILSLLFLVLTLHYLLRWAESDERSILLKSCACYVLALLSKENGVILFLIAPLTAYTFTGLPLRTAFRKALPIPVLAVGYVLMRAALMGTRQQAIGEVMDDPYLLATDPEKIATILHVLQKYVGLLLFPHPLSYDYSYARIPYRTFSDPTVWTAAALLVLTVLAAVRGVFRKVAVAWCATFFLATWILVSGLFWNIGAPLAERFMYQASLPFTIMVTVLGQGLLMRVIPDQGRQRALATLLLVPVSLLSGFAVVRRNADWRSDDTLLLHDVLVSPQSARAQTYAGIALLRRTEQPGADVPALCREALVHFATADSIKRDYLPTLLNAGSAWFKLDSIDAAARTWDRVRGIEPGNGSLKRFEAMLGSLHYRRGLEAGVRHDLNTSISELGKAVRYAPERKEAWYNLGGAYYTIGDTTQARTCWERTLRIDPRDQDAQRGLRALSQ